MQIGSRNWLEARRKFITATDAPVIMGIEKFKTLYDLYWEKREGVSQESKPWMIRGKILEQDARRFFESEMGDFLPETFVISEQYPWAAATLDGWNGKELLVEIKCPGAEDHETAIREVVPRHYYPQLQWQLLVTGLNEMFYCSYNPDHPVKTVFFKVERDDKYLLKMVKKAEEFFQILQQEDIPEQFKKDDLEFDLLPSFLKEKEKELYDLMTEFDALEKKIEATKKEVLENFKDKPVKGSLLEYKKIKRKGTINYKIVPELEGVDLEPYRNPCSEYWKIDIVQHDS